MIVEEFVTNIFHNGGIVEDATIAPLFLKFDGKTYATKGHIHQEVACKNCAFYGGSCPRTLNGEFICKQLEVSNGVAYFEDLTV